MLGFSARLDDNKKCNIHHISGGLRRASVCPGVPRSNIPIGARAAGKLLVLRWLPPDISDELRCMTNTYNGPKKTSSFPLNSGGANLSTCCENKLIWRSTPARGNAIFKSSGDVTKGLKPHTHHAFQILLATHQTHLRLLVTHAADACTTTLFGRQRATPDMPKLQN
jgi:hypothetical protein